MGLVVTVAPTIEPLTVAEVTDHLRCDSTADLSGYIAAARLYAENYTGRAFISRTLRYTLDAFPCSGIITLPRPNLLSVTSVSYVDTNGTTQTLSISDYTVDTDALPGRIFLNYGVSWPSTRCQLNAVTILYKAGYGTTAATVPDSIKSAMKLFIGDLYENREGAIIGAIRTENPAVDQLLWSERVVEFA